MKAYLEYNDNTSNKFWKIEVRGKMHTIQYGKIGSQGRNKKKEFTSKEEAKKAAEKLIASKLKLGYAEVLSAQNSLENKKIASKRKRKKLYDELSLAIEKNDLSFMKELLSETGVEEAIHIAVQEIPHDGSNDALMMLLETRPNEHALSSSLCNAIYADRIDMIKTLIDSQQPMNKGEALITAIEEGKTEIVSLLLDLGNDVNYAMHKPDEIYTPLITAIKAKNVKIIKLLIAHGVDVNLKTTDSELPLDAAARLSNKTICMLMKEAGAHNITPEDLNIKEAAINNFPDRVKLLVKKASKEDMEIALRYAANSGFYDIVKILLKKKLSKNALNDALVSSCSGGNGTVTVVQALIDAGADVSAEGTVGYTTLKWARKNNNHDIIALLEKKGVIEHQETIKTRSRKKVEEIENEIIKNPSPFIRILMEEIEAIEDMEETFDDEEEDPDSEEIIKPWESNLGCLPYLPKTFSMPRDPDGEFLAFFAQINFEEMPPIPGFPKKGILQFYINPESGSWNTAYEVVFFRSVIKDARKLQAPPEYEKVLKSCYKMDFRKDTAYPYPRDYHFDTIMKKFRGLGMEVEERVEAHFSDFQGENAGHRIGGYAFFTREDPRQSKKYKNYILLLQIDQLDSEADQNTLWKSSGVGNFFIHPDDLKKRDFSKVLFHWDCY
ncbi:MAG: DUF1963 domain-containing protein [bacterium]|nr:DUF1963 domain-containing protein [bacterium]